MIIPPNYANTLRSFVPNSMTDVESYAVFRNSTFNIVLEISGKNALTLQMYLGKRYADSSELSGYCVSNILRLYTMSSGS